MATTSTTRGRRRGDVLRRFAGRGREPVPGRERRHDPHRHRVLDRPDDDRGRRLLPARRRLAPRSGSSTTRRASRSSRSMRRTTRSPSRRTAELWVERTPPGLHVRHQGPRADDRPADRDEAAARRTCARPSRARSPRRRGSTPRTSPTTSRTTSGRGSPTAWSRWPRPASSGRSCSSTRAGSSPRRRTATRSRTPSIDCARSA